MNRQPVTCWYKWDKTTERWEFNHIEGGHSQEWRPVPRTDLQRQAWINQQWDRAHAYLDENNQVIGERREIGK